MDSMTNKLNAAYHIFKNMSYALAPSSGKPSMDYVYQFNLIKLTAQFTRNLVEL